MNKGVYFEIARLMAQSMAHMFALRGAGDYFTALRVGSA